MTIQDSKDYLNEALITAARFGHTGNMEALIKLGADLHVREEMPLRLAAANGHQDTVNVLLAHGANADRALFSAASVGAMPDVVGILGCAATSPALVAIRDAVVTVQRHRWITIPKKPDRRQPRP
jgi:ankyrin repeat protein